MAFELHNQEQKSNLERLDDDGEHLACGHPEHNPPSHMVYSPGRYRWTCPGCGAKRVFTVHGPVW